MKTAVIQFLVFSAVLTAVADYPIIRGAKGDGGFEQGEADQLYSSCWKTKGFNAEGGTPQRSVVRSGRLSASVGMEKCGERLGIFQKTGHIVAAGEKYILTFFWTTRWGWEDSDQLGYRLFVTDNNEQNGRVIEIVSGAVDGKSGENSAGGSSLYGDPVEILSHEIAVGSPVEGKKIWLEFFAFNAGPNKFARIDDVTLSVWSEPETLGMVFY